MPLFGTTDPPAAVMATIREQLAAGGLHDLLAEGITLAQKLRLVGVYDDRQEGFFMLRTRIPGGRLTWQQAEAIGRVAGEFSLRPAGGAPDLPERFIEITTRQDIQLHWIRVSDLGAIWDRFEAVGLTSLQACGDTARNVTGCPVSGIDSGERLHTFPLVQALDSRVLGDSERGAYLPRKFKIAITGCLDDCILAGINDLAFTPAERDGQTGFSAWVGGGLSDYPRLASKLDLFVTPTGSSMSPPRSSTSSRPSGTTRTRPSTASGASSRSWGPSVCSASCWTACRAVGARRTELTRSPRYDHVGVHPQPQPGLSYVGLAVPVGRMLAGDLAEAARLAREYGDGNVRLTPRQNLVISGVGDQRLPGLLREPLLERFSPNPRPFVRSVVACTSAPFCKFGIFNVKQRGVELASLLDDGVEDGEFPPVRLHLSGLQGVLRADPGGGHRAPRHADEGRGALC